MACSHNVEIDALSVTMRESIAAWQLFPLPAFPTVPSKSQGTEHHWFDSDAMEHQIGSMVDNAVSQPTCFPVEFNELLYFCYTMLLRTENRELRIATNTVLEYPGCVISHASVTHRCFDTCAIVRPQVDRALAERGQHLGLSGPSDNAAEDEENVAKLDGMKEEMEVMTWLSVVVCCRL